MLSECDGNGRVGANQSYGRARRISRFPRISRRTQLKRRKLSRARANNTSFLPKSNSEAIERFRTRVKRTAKETHTRTRRIRRKVREKRCKSNVGARATRDVISSCIVGRTIEYEG